jgi:hypothetical protein
MCMLKPRFWSHKRAIQDCPSVRASSLLAQHRDWPLLQLVSAVVLTLYLAKGHAVLRGAVPAGVSNMITILSIATCLGYSNSAGGWLVILRNV